MFFQNHIYVRVIFEIIGLAAMAWVLSVFIEPDPIGVNVVRLSPKWFTYTYFTAATVYVLIPLGAIFVLGGLIGRLITHRPNYWRIYRIAFIATAIWLVIGNYGHWYGKCRSHDSVGSCQSSEN